MMHGLVHEPAQHELGLPQRLRPAHGFFDGDEPRCRIVVGAPARPLRACGDREDRRGIALVAAVSFARGRAPHQRAMVACRRPEQRRREVREELCAERRLTRTQRIERLAHERGPLGVEIAPSFVPERAQPRAVAERGAGEHLGEPGLARDGRGPRKRARAAGRRRPPLGLRECEQQLGTSRGVRRSRHVEDVERAAVVADHIFVASRAIAPSRANRVGNRLLRRAAGTAAR
jgi:hypothetical protein